MSQDKDMNALNERTAKKTADDWCKNQVISPNGKSDHNRETVKAKLIKKISKKKTSTKTDSEFLDMQDIPITSVPMPSSYKFPFDKVKISTQKIVRVLQMSIDQKKR